MLKILKLTLIGLLRGPVSAPVPASDKLEAIRRITQLLREAGFAPGIFDAHAVFIFDCNQKELNFTGYTL